MLIFPCVQVKEMISLAFFGYILTAGVKWWKKDKNIDHQR